MTKKIKKKVKWKSIIVLGVIIIMIIIMLILLFSIKDKNSIVGTWTTDNVTIYEFNKDKTGYLVVPLGKYKFNYKTQGDSLYIDFDNDKSEDTDYIYSFKDKKLILKGINGTFTFSRIEK